MSNPSQPEIVVFTGCPASGKSTTYKKTYSATHVHINLDTLKTRKKELAAIDAAIRDRKDIVIDNTNPSREARKVYIDIAKAAGYLVGSVEIYAPGSICIDRNGLRDTPVPKVAIYSYLKKYERPALDEGFDYIAVLQLT